MLIEAARNGHTDVVNLLLDWPQTTLSPAVEATTTDLATQTNLDANQQPRVPMHGLGNVVPPQDPNKTSNEASLAAAALTSTQYQAQAIVQQVQQNIQNAHQSK